MRFVLATATGVMPLGAVDGDAPLVGVIAGDDVALHRVQLMETAPKRRLAEAGMRATDLAAQSVDALHVALGDPDANGTAWMAIVDRERMAAHVDHFARHGAEVGALVPAALLLDAPDAGVRVATLDGLVLVRGGDVAAATDLELAAALGGGAPDGAFAAGFSPPDTVPLDLLQGDFAPRVRWWRLGWFRWAFGLLVLLALALGVAPTVIERLRHGAAVAAADKASVALAEQALGTRPQSADVAAAGMLAARQAREGAALGARLSFVSAAIEAVPGARMEALRLAPDGALQVKLGGPAEAVNGAAARLRAGPFVAGGTGREVTLGVRQPARAGADSALPVALARTWNVRADAAVVRAAGAAPAALAPAAVAELFAAAGLEVVLVEGAPATIEAARSVVLLPLLADIEARGGRIARLDVTRNADGTLAAEIGFAQ